MTPQKFKQIRVKLGYSQKEMAYRLGLANGRSIRYYEAGATTIPKPVALLMWLFSGEKTVRDLLK